MRLAPLTPEPLRQVIDHLRPADREEVFANRPDDDPQALADHVLIHAGRLAWIAGMERPIAAFGAVPLGQDQWSAWCFATDAFPRIAAPLTRFCRVRVRRSLVEVGATRVCCASLVSHHAAHRWLERLGARREGLLAGYGRGGEDFVMYVWEESALKRS